MGKVLARKLVVFRGYGLSVLGKNAIYPCYENLNTTSLSLLITSFQLPSLSLFTKS